MIQGEVVDDHGDVRSPTRESSCSTAHGRCRMSRSSQGPTARSCSPCPRPGTYRLAVHADGYDGAEATVEVPGDRPATVRLRLRRSDQA